MKRRITAKVRTGKKTASTKVTKARKAKTVPSMRQRGKIKGY